MSIDVHRLAFRDEARELLSELESSLLELEQNPEDLDIVNRVFRAMHTIKGSGAMFGYDDVSSFTHEIETVFDLVRNHEVPVSKELLDVVLSSRDHIQNLLDASDNQDEPDLAAGEALVARLRAAAGLPPKNAGPLSGIKLDLVASEDADGEFATIRVRFKPLPGFFATGNNPLNFLDDLREKGVTYVFPHFERLPDLAELDPETCHMWWDVILSTREDLSAVRDIFMFVEEDCELSVEVIDRGQAAGEDADYKKLGEILLERGDIKLDALRKALSEQKKLGAILAESGLVTASQVTAALGEQKAVREIRASREPKREVAAEAGASIRVAADKLDFLVDLVGELVIVQSQIKQACLPSGDPLLLSLSEQLERLSSDLRDSTLGIRMLPIGGAFGKLRRLVRDLSSELGKEIELVTRGEQTELDKTVIERLGDPLVHLLRNSIDHGIETPQIRKDKGKPGKGSIVLSAEHSGGEVLIEITDDGAGIDPAKVLAKAVEKGLIGTDEDLSEKQIFNLIFAPGFSTAQSVTSVSGRGVGMDVVKRSIDSLRGNVDVSSRLGLGTTIAIRLPLTLAIIEGLQIRVGDEYYVLPLALVEECVELVGAGEGEQGLGQLINLRGESVPYIRLRELFDVPGESPRIEQIVVVGLEGGRYGLVVDTVIGEHQTVIKSLGRVYRDLEGFSGATIRGDGSLALIVDVQGLVRLALGKAKNFA